MRTMSIQTAILLVCSLAQFAIASNIIKFPECGVTYECFAAASCTSSVQFDAGVIDEIFDYKDVFKDCSVFLRVHAYATNWVHISITSFKSADTITIRQFDPTNPNRENILLECSGSKENSEGKYNGVTKQRIKKDYIHDQLVKLQCTFEVRLKAGASVFNSDLFTQFEVTTAPSKKPITTRRNKQDFLKNLRCNPAAIMFSIEQKSEDHKYERVSYKVGKLSCSPNFEIEYRDTKSDTASTNTYKKISEGDLTCEIAQFTVNSGNTKPETYIAGELIYIRCVAEARHFCLYDVKTVAGRKGLEREQGTAIMKCPADAKFLVVKDQHFTNPIVKCKNHGGTELLWTIEGNGKKLTVNGPESYCTNELECHRLNRIPESSLLGGAFRGKDHLPTCDKNVTLEVDQTNATVKCDLQTGYFKYSINGTEKVVDKNTIFKCKLPQIKDDKQNEANRTVLLSTLIPSLILTVIAGIAIIVGGVYFSNKRIQQMKKKAEEALAEKDLAGNEFCMEEDEYAEWKAEQKKKRKKGNGQVECEKTAPKENQSKWNDQAMTILSRIMSFLTRNDPLRNRVKEHTISHPIGEEYVKAKGEFEDDKELEERAENDPIRKYEEKLEEEFEFELEEMYGF